PRSHSCALSFFSLVPRPRLPSFPTRRSSDLDGRRARHRLLEGARGGLVPAELPRAVGDDAERAKRNRGLTRLGHDPLRLVDCGLDRKSTRLNSSHQIISYAVFCLKKKKHKHT